jgi:hypothetical protein
MGRKITTEDEARRCLRAAKAASQTPGEWARAHGIDGRSLNMFRVNLERSSRSTALRLVELVPAPRTPAQTRYLVRVGDQLAVELSDDFQEETVLRLVRVLRSC